MEREGSSGSLGGWVLVEQVDNVLSAMDYSRHYFKESERLFLFLKKGGGKIEKKKKETSESDSESEERGSSRGGRREEEGAWIGIGWRGRLRPAGREVRSCL